MEKESINDKRVIEHFDKLAEHHGDVHAVLDASPTRKPEIAHQNVFRDYILKYGINKFIPFRSTDIVLDFGCGVGRLSSWMAQKVKFVEGTDISASMLKVASEINAAPNIRYLHLTEDLPYEANYFDKIITCWVLQHISDQRILEILADMKRMMKPGAAIYIMEQIPTKPQEKVSNELYTQRTLEEYKTLFDKAGFDTIEQRPIFRSPSYALSIWSKYKWFPKSMLSLLGMVEHKTLYRKPEHVIYYTYLMTFKPR